MAFGDRVPAQDFNTLATGNANPYGIWSNGTTMWVVDSVDDKIYAYNLSTKLRDEDKDFNTLVAAGNDVPLGIWSDGATMWVADNGNDKIYAYRMSDKTRDASKDFDTLADAGNYQPQGIWSDGTTMWVADSQDDKLYAYKMSDKTRDSTKDLDTLIAAGNTNPSGIWSDRTTMWVTNSGFDRPNKLFAYNLSTKLRDEDKDFDTLTAARNTHPYGIWSNGTTMWVADWEDDKIYAYNSEADAVPIITFEASSTSVHLNTDVTLTWATTDAETVTLNGVTVAASGSQVVTSATAQSIVYELIAINLSSSSTRTITVTWSELLPSIDTFATTANLLHIGQDITLTWTMTNAVTVTLNGVGVQIDSGRTITGLAHPGIVQYVLVATNSDGSIQEIINVEWRNFNPVIDSFISNIGSDSVHINSPAVLSWQTSQADAVTLDTVAVTVDGQQQVTSTTAQTVTYTLSATNSAYSGTTTVTATVQVSYSDLTPVITLTASTTTADLGQVVTITWNVTGADNVLVEVLQAPAPLQPATPSAYTSVLDDIEASYQTFVEAYNRWGSDTANFPASYQVARLAAAAEVDAMRTALQNAFTALEAIDA